MPLQAIVAIARALMRDRRANVAILTALAMPVLIGSVGIGAEVASWYGGKRGMQNAADSAAIAAATNGTDDGYDDEARAVAAQYGYVPKPDNSTTVVAANHVACPAGGTDCYQVTISRLQPLFFAQIVGFRGDVEKNGTPYKVLTSTAVATQGTAPREYCILALATSGAPTALRTNGAPFADLSGCNVMSNTDAVCNGHDLGAEVGDAHGVNDGCGKKRNSKTASVADPYAKLAENIPDIDCPEGYPTAPVKKKDAELPPKNRLSGTENRTLIPMCGDVVLDDSTTITGGDTVLVIKNGSLDLKGHTLSTQDGSSLTIIFTGDDNRSHAPIGSGKLDIAAPTTGDWKGVAMFQDPATKHGVDISEAGNQPTWNITGLVYLPRANVTFSGAVSKASSGKACFAMVVDSLLINGTGSILDHGECEEAGLTLPTGKAPTRGELVS